MDISTAPFKNKGLFVMVFRLSALCLCLFFCSCASVSVKKTEQLVDQPPTRVPDKILVRPFSFYEPALRVDRKGESLRWLKNEVREDFTRNFVRYVEDYIAPAQAIAATAPLPRGNYWLVEGRFDRVYQGSRLLRSLIGFGSGGTKLEASVVVYDLSSKKPRPFLLIETTGGSGAAPGAIGTAGYFVTGVGALTSLFNLLEGVRSGLSFDTTRTSKEVASQLTEYLYKKGAIPKEKVVPAKHLGEVSYPWWPFNPSRTKVGTVTVIPVGTAEPAKKIAPPAK